jgi:hypothetical protein
LNTSYLLLQPVQVADGVGVAGILELGVIVGVVVFVGVRVGV